MKKRFALYGMFAAMAIFASACGDDSSSSASAPEDEEYSSAIDDEESSSSEKGVSSSSTKKGKSSSSEKAVSSSSAKKDGKSSSSEAKKDDKSSSSEKADSSSSSEPESSSSSVEEPLVSVAPYCEVVPDEKNSEKLFVKYGVGTFSLSILFDTGDKASVYLKRKGESCSQIMDISRESYSSMPGLTCKVTDCSETDGIATYIEDCEVDKETSGMPSAAVLKSSYDENCKTGFYKEAPTSALNKEMLSDGKYGLEVDMRPDANYNEEYGLSPYVYRTIKVGNQTWMAQNLNYATSSGSSCYGGEEGNCDTYGRLYTLEVAQTACPDGWRLPTATEWHELLTKTMEADSSSMEEPSTGIIFADYSGAGVSFLGGTSHANTYGLSFVLGGAYGTPFEETLEYNDLDKSGVYWLDDESVKGNTPIAVVANYDDVEKPSMLSNVKAAEMQLSVRCIKK